MKQLNFPLLTKDDIEVRIGQLNKNGDKATLLLYKTSRTDSDILDKIVGQGNWQKRFYTLNGVGLGDNMRSIVVCSVGIYDEDKHEWVWKDDSGTESNVEQDKGVCSDAFKRAAGGSSWGIGRELYSAPTIWVSITSKYDKFKVASIDYNQDREISGLEIANEKGEIVYTYGTKKSYTPKKESVNPVAKADTVDENAPIRKEELEWLFNWIKETTEERYANFQGWLKKTFGTDDVAELTASQGIIVCARLGKK